MLIGVFIFTYETNVILYQYIYTPLLETQYYGIDVKIIGNKVLMVLVGDY